MRDLIACALTWVLNLFPWTRRPEPGRHTAHYLTAHPQTECPVSPWSRPWAGPTKEQAAARFRQEAEDTLKLRVVQQHRRRALYYATHGIDYPYIATTRVHQAHGAVSA
ncbi:hypothetical protein [Streptomyces sp. CAU 1734]|uniref:hypothetical protein n=1 Tax=Streptomyces sp. CAU 1734 TaxID=3140360 RepID=UPI0032606597